MALSALPFSFSSVSSLRSSLQRTELKAGNSWNSTFSTKSQTKKDDMRKYRMERTPFLEEQVRVINERGGLMSMDIERLLLSEDNRFDFVNEVAAEAISYVESNRDEYGGTKKAILHVLSNRMNDAGFSRPEAYAESDPFKPGPGYLKEELT
ncbi:protein PLASTID TRANSCRIPTIONALLY ACTIVE 7 isoform X3 [Tripterygium wilfordii]|uniref:protein PLASTID TRANSCRIPTIONALLY ACTIVE 7 isoform X3 n=1 Tax=Tripterygium wilfordii TaxID=458696 RepID=UPI0018F832D5|nr:protein PLASTID TRANSCRIPTIONALLY ACTIVE 7 isoform X3 [Tripterygium wilfordii]